MKIIRIMRRLKSNEKDKNLESNLSAPKNNFMDSDKEIWIKVKINHKIIESFYKVK